jgi:hypothetical protein
LRTRRQISIPSMSGSIRSRMINAGWSAATWVSAAVPVVTARTS